MKNKEKISKKCQPTKSELKKDLRIPTTPENLLQAVDQGKGAFCK